MRRAERALLGLICLVMVGGCAGAPAADAPAAPQRPAATGDQPLAGSAGEAAAGSQRPASAEPTAMRIPSIDVTSPLLSLGITPDGAAEVPEDYDLAGWFNGGGRPGERGPTVLLGHVDSTDGPAVFFRLRDLEPGDVIEVDTADGAVARYAVDRTEQVPKDTFPTFAVFGATPDDVLRLVTCAGEFDRGERSYIDNFVVHATRLAA